MRRTIRIIALLLAVTLLSAMLAGCSLEKVFNKDKREISELLSDFESACNSMDVDAMLDCLSPKITDKIEAALDVYGLFTDKDAQDVIDGISKNLTDDSESIGSEFFSSLIITLNDITVEDDKATAHTAVATDMSLTIRSAYATPRCSRT